MVSEQGKGGKQKLIAFFGDPAQKAFYLERIRQHKTANEIIQGYTWTNDGRGCAVGCTIHGYRHADYETLLGIPQVLAILEDKIFEGLPLKKAQEFSEQFLDAIPVGADLTKVWQQFARWLLIDSENGVIKYVKTEEQHRAIEQTAQLYKKKTAELNKDAISAAQVATRDGAALPSSAPAKAACYAANWIAYAASTSDNAEIALAAANAIGHAFDAYDAATAHPRPHAYFLRLAEKLLQLLRNAPVVTTLTSQLAFM